MKKTIFVFLLLPYILLSQSNSNILSTGINLDEKLKNDTICENWNKFYEDYQKRNKTNSNREFSSSKYNRFGGGIYGFLNQQNANFKGYDDVIYPSCCTEIFGKKNGFGFGAKGSYEKEIADNSILGIDLGFNSFGQKLESIEKMYLSDNGSLDTINNVHSLDNKLMSFEITPSFHYRITNEIAFKIGIPLNYIITASTTQKEELPSDSKYTFKETNTKTRNEKTGDIPNINKMLFGLSAGISYEYKLNSIGTDFIVPELSYNLNFNKLSNNLDWTWSSIRFGVSYKMSPNQTIDTIDYRRINEEYNNDLLKIAVYKEKACLPPKVITGITVNLTGIFGIKADGTKEKLKSNKLQTTENKLFTIDQVKFDGAHTLLNYVFFDDNSYKIPTKYARIEDNQRMSYNENDFVNKNTIDVYYQILNIVGSRLAKDQSAKITLTGYNSNNGTEENNLELSKRRAEEIKFYLESTFKVKPNQIQITYDNLPKRSTKTKDKFGDEENRRVEITANKPSILAPILVKDNNVTSLNYEKIEVQSEISSGDNVIQISQGLVSSGGELFGGIRDTSGKNFKLSRTFNLKDRNDLMVLMADQIDVEVRAIDSKGKDAKDGDAIIIDLFDFKRKEQMKLNDKILENYILILPYGDAELSEDNKDMAKFAKARLTDKNSILTIKGYTDATGTTENNSTLSQERADKIGQYLNLKNTTTKGYGVSKIYDNNLPEGRFYNRRVEIEIETPIKRQ